MMRFPHEMGVVWAKFKGALPVTIGTQSGLNVTETVQTLPTQLLLEPAKV